MRKLGIIFVLLLLPVVFADVSVYKVWSPYEPPNSPIIHVDISEQIIYIGIVNKDEYEHDVIVKAECNGKTWKSGIISLPPNSHKEKIVEVRVPISKDEEQDVKISLIENGKTIASKTIKVKPYFPIDVKNVTCEDAYDIDDSNEVCYSNWFDVILKSNPIAKSDYIAKVWINVKDDNGNIIYDGKNNSKTVYIPCGEEVKLSFKVPNITIDTEKFLIETNVEVMNFTHSVEGFEETTQRRDESGIYYDYNSKKKYFYLPIVVKSVNVYKNIDENTTNYVRKFYYSSGILDDEIQRILSEQRYYYKNDALPRYYVEDDPILAILNITLEDKYNKDILAKLILKYENKTVIKTINIDKNNTKDVLVPIYPKKDNKDIETIVYPEDVNNLIFKKSFSVSLNPIPVSPVIIEKVLLPNDKNIETDTNNSANVLVGETYNMVIFIKNIYNKTLSGKITIEDNFDKDVANYSNEIPFTIKPHETLKINVPITFNKEVNGDLKITVSTNKGAKDYTTSVHFYAMYPIEVIRVKYNNTLLGRINTIKGEDCIYASKPVAGFNNTCIVKLRNNLKSTEECYVWVEVIDKDGNIRAKSNIKTVNLKPKSEVEIKFPIFFNEGFEGYTIVHVVPKYLKHVDIVYTEGVGFHLVKIPDYYRIGRYSEIDILGNKIPTGAHEVTEVISPINIEEVSYNNSSNTLCAKLRNDKFPVNLTVQYWAEIQRGSKIYYISSIFQTDVYPKSEQIVEIPLNLDNLENGDYNITLYTKINDFALLNNHRVPVILKKSISIKINNSNNKGLTKLNNLNNLSNESSNKSIIIQNYSINRKTNSPLDKINNNIKKINNITKKENLSSINKSQNSIFNSIVGVISEIISSIFGIFR